MPVPASKTSFDYLTDLALRLSNNFMLYSETYFRLFVKAVCLLFIFAFVSSFSIYFFSTFTFVLYSFLLPLLRLLLNPTNPLLPLALLLYLLPLFLYLRILFSPTFSDSPSVTFHHPGRHLITLQGGLLA
jgi:hypothetical protein